MAKILTTAQLKKMYSQICENHFLITLLDYEDLVQVSPYAQKIKKTISDEIDRLITLTPDYIPTVGLEYDKVFRHWSTRYNAGEYLKVDNICTLLFDNLIKNKTFEDKMGLTEYYKKNESKPFFDFTDKSDTEKVSEPVKKIFTARSYCLAYLYLYKSDVTPIESVKKNPFNLTKFSQDIANKHALNSQTVKKHWRAIQKNQERVNKSNIVNIKLSIEVLKSFEAVNTEGALIQANKEYNKALLDA